MKESLTLRAKIFCRWLGWHWPDKKRWEYKGIHTVCKLCHRVITKKGKRWV